MENILWSYVTYSDPIINVIKVFLVPTRQCPQWHHNILDKIQKPFSQKLRKNIDQENFWIQNLWYLLYTIKKKMLFCIPRNWFLTVGPWADVKNGFAWKIIIVLKVRGGHGE